MADDPTRPMPSIVPGRDDIDGQANRRSARGDRRRSDRSGGNGGGGSGILARLFITVSLVVAAVACAWAWQLQQELKAADSAIQDYAQRISDLEDRLSDTDEGMAQSAELQAIKLTELDGEVDELESEIRKLWDNVWKKSKARLDALEAAGAKQGPVMAQMQEDIDGVQSQLEAASGDLAKLKGVAGDLSRLMANAKANQSEVERVADTLNRIELEMNKLSKRVQANEEWVGSVNAFRKQVNASLIELRSAVNAQQAAP